MMKLYIIFFSSRSESFHYFVCQLRTDEEKFELEKKERIQKLENEKQEKKLMFDLLKKCLGERI